MSIGVVGGSVAALSLMQDHEQSYVLPSPCHDKPTSSPTSSPGNKFKGRRPAQPAADTGAEKVLRSFNTWAFKREQPSDPQLILRLIADAMAAREPIRFVLYWGKGPRHRTAAPEAQCLDFLASLAARVKSAYAPGAAIKLIFTDTHAELNGHRREDIVRYFDDVQAAAEQRGFATCWLGQLVKAAGHLATAAPLEEAVPAETLATLVASAQKWYRGSDTPQEGALTYLRMNLIEQRVVERVFPGTIFMTFNGSEMRCLFPKQLPIFYMYSLRRGFSVKPWFLPAEPAQAEFGADQANPIRPGAA